MFSACEGRRQFPQAVPKERAPVERFRHRHRFTQLGVRRLQYAQSFSEVRGTKYRPPATLSARRAGYHNPAQAGRKLLTLVKIEMAIQAVREVEEIRRQAKAKRTAPLDYQPVEEVRPQVLKVPGAMDRRTHSAELVDERLLIEAVLGGCHGIPSDILSVNPAKLNEYARSLQERISRWPGVRYKKTMRTI